jgi:oxygen-dependent protoporphyrinogen oxidase
MGVLVVGGGITGLVAARALARDGVPVMLAEAGDRLGGKVSTERFDGFTVERGPDSFLATRPAAISLARELGLGDELVGTRDPRAVYIRHRGELVPMPEGLGLVLPTRALPFAKSRLFSWPEKLRMAVDVVSPRRLGTEDVAVGTFLRGRLGDPLVDRLAGPLVGGVYGTPIDELSLDAVVPQLRTAEREHRSLLFAGLADGRAMRRAMAARPAGARSLGVFVSLRGGMDRLTDALVASAISAGADLRTGLGVRALMRAGSGVAARFVDGSLARFDAVVIAAPAP